jgi:hypothetical protein
MVNTVKNPGFPAQVIDYITKSPEVARMVVLTQAEYDAIPVKDPNTLYFIIL